MNYIIKQQNRKKNGKKNGESKTNQTNKIIDKNGKKKFGVIK